MTESAAHKCPSEGQREGPVVHVFFAFSVTVDAIAVPCKLSVDGETEHVELAGAPLQERAIAPVSPLIGVNVMV